MPEIILTLDIGTQSTRAALVSAAGEMQCEHGNTCKVLCGISASMLHQDAALSAFEKSDRWLPTDTLAVKSSFLSRLERPPRL